MAPRGQVARRRKGLDLSRTLGPLVVQWIERELVHGPGDVEGQRILLDDERVRFLCHAYALDDRGRRLIDRAVISRSKGWAKSELLAMIASAEALGPVRFNGWDHSGRPLGRPVQAPLVRLAATEEGQTDNTYAAVEFMLREGAISRLRREGLDVGLTRTFTPNGGKIVGITARASSKDGGKETFAGFDETHLYVTPELIRLHQVIRRNLAKRKAAEPWSVETTTMYAPGENSVAEASHAYAQKIIAGSIKDPRLLFDHLQGPAEIDFLDDDELRAALVEAYGDAAAWIDIERLIAESRDPQTDESDFRRYFLNQPTARSSSWMNMAVWRDLKVDRTFEEIAKGTQVVLGFDGSVSDDCTAIVGCTVEEIPHLFVVEVWEKDDRDPDWTVPRQEVDETVRWCMRKSGWNVLELAADPPHWYREIDAWADEYGDVVVTKFRTNLRSFMARACKKLKAAAGNRYVTHDGDLVLDQHIANAVAKVWSSDGDEYITKDYRHSPRKIDAAIGAVIAFDRATERREGNRSAYDKPGKELVVSGPLEVELDVDEDEDGLLERLPDDRVPEWLRQLHEDQYDEED